MNILVTGGAGFVGANLCAKLMDKGYQVFIIDDLSTGSMKNIEHLENHPKFHCLIETVLNRSETAKIVDKCGTRDYWENWANDIAKIAQTHITRINAIVLNSGTPERKAFLSFLEEIRDDLNPEITETDAVEMLAQHIITRPVFDILFQGNKFISDNAVSKAMETVLGQLYKYNLETESETLQKFYDSVKRRAADIITATGRQALVLELYDRFFRTAFPMMTQKLGIVYTPVEVVDFIINSVNDVLKEEFGKCLGNDLNIASALGCLFSWTSEMFTDLDKNRVSNESAILAIE